MLLRRITEHVKAQNWTAVALDFVIVVVGVFMGIQVSNWNQSRIDRQDEAVFLEDLHEDIEQVQTLSTRLLERRRSNFAALGGVVDRLNGHGDAPPYTEEDCFSIISSDVFYIGRADMPSLIQLRNAGRTTIISDRRLQKSLASLTLKRDAMDLVVSSLSNNLTDFRKEYSAYFRFGSNMIPDPSRPGQEEREPTIIECRADSLLENNEARNALTINLEFYDAFMRDGLEPWHAQLLAVHLLLDEMLDLEHVREDAP